MGTLLARLLREEFRMPRRPRKEQIRVLLIRIKQNLLFDLQGVMNMTALSIARSEMITSHSFPGWRVTIIEYYKQLLKRGHITSEMRTPSK